MLEAGAKGIHVAVGRHLFFLAGDRRVFLAAALSRHFEQMQFPDIPRYGRLRHPKSLGIGNCGEHCRRRYHHVRDRQRRRDKGADGKNPGDFVDGDTVRRTRIF